MTLVLKIGGATCLEPTALDALVQAWNGAGQPAWLLVHGGGPQLDAALLAVQGPAERLEGLRRTTPEGAAVVARELDKVGAALAAGLHARGVPSLHLPAAERRLRARPKTVTSGDVGRVGDAVEWDVAALGDRAGQPGILVTTPVGWDETGPLNVNADEGAVRLAADIGATDLVFLTDVPGVMDAAGHVIAVMDDQQALALIATGVAAGGMIPKLRAANDALQQGVEEVCIGDHAALQGAGTRIRAAPQRVAA